MIVLEDMDLVIFYLVIAHCMTNIALLPLFLIFYRIRYSFLVPYVVLRDNTSYNVFYGWSSFVDRKMDIF